MDPRLEGVWALVDDDDDAVSRGAASPRAVYTILGSAGRAGSTTVYLHVRWTAASGQRQESSLHAVPDGNRHAVGGTAGKELQCTAGPGRLDTAMFDDGVAVHVARRSLTADGQHMRVVQELLAPDGRTEEAVSTYARARTKQVMCYRRDLKMRKGKIAAQCAHASMAVFFRRDEGGIDRLEVQLDGAMAAWAKRGFAKVVLSVDGEEDLVRVYNEATERGIPAALITDSGRTEFGGVPTRTAVAIGPAVAAELDAITGPEGLVKTKLA